MPRSPRVLAVAAFLLLFPGNGCSERDVVTSDPDGTVTAPTTGRNRLAHETSPYLLQHANNPVDWYPWGDEAFAKAKETGKPLLVSIGYSSCHWCHVMEHESFEDEETAKVMNELFVCVKVDREERPDVDEVYMTAMQMMGLGGGWPLNVFVTPDGVPFYGGTYFPPDRRYGRPSWREVLAQVATVWKEKPEAITKQGQEIVAALRGSSDVAADGVVPAKQLLDRAANEMLGRFDDTNGGFQGSPKFPHVASLELALSQHARNGDARLLRFVELTLRKMAEGGIYDQLGGGFHRYSTDEKWLVPHFEKMLYDNAELARVYVEAYQVTGDEFYARIARETLDYVLREMTEKGGGFRSATDADSDGREGVYFVWTKPEITEQLGKNAPLFLEAYGVTEAGNFVDPHHPRQPGEPGMNVLHVAKRAAELAAAHGREVPDVEASLAKSRETLFRHRKGRTYPGLDDKVLASWNALMIGAMAYGGRVLDEPRYVAAAEKAGDFLLREMRTPDGGLLRTHRAGRSKIDAFLEDYAYLADAYLDLYETTFDPRWYRAATALANDMEKRFGDAEAGGWYHTAIDAEELVTRTRSAFDGAIPSGNGVAARVMVRLSAMTAEPAYRGAAERAFRAFAPAMERHPSGTVTLLRALDRWLHEDGEIAFVGDPGKADMKRLIRPVHHAYLPGTVLALLRPGDEDTEQLIPMLAGKKLVGKDEAVYVCRDFSCQAPVTTVEAVEQAISGL